MIEGILIALKLIFAVLSFLFEKNSDTKKRKKAGIEQVLKGIEDEDPSAISAGFGNINR